VHKCLGVGLPPTSTISKNKFFAETPSAKTSSFVFSALALLASTLVHAQNPINALPTGGQVVAGQVAISQTSNATSATMNVNQASQRAIVNWDSFNVGKNAQVNFNQPNQNAVILNRVTGASSSVIDGAIKANGQVILVNQNGVTFGKGSQVDAAGVTASTLDIANKDFMDGKSTYKGNGQGVIFNEGKITTNSDGGYIALLAPEVRNQGYLLAKKGSGTVAVAAGEQITLNFQSNSLISVKVDVATYNGLIENKRVVEVNGGLVVMAAGAANQLMASVIKNTGRISASSAVNNGGIIEFVANTVTQAGKVLANSKSAQGGQINIVGNDITIAANSKTTATGATGGGQVNVGLASTAVSGGNQVNASASQNNFQSQAIVKANAIAASNSKQMAKTVTMEQGSIIDTSATQSGNGGSIAIWSELKTIVAGTLQSMGGLLSGNGGFIETSSKGVVALSPTANITTRANSNSGKSGTWLLDPIDLTIDATAANVISAALANNNVVIEVNANTVACPGMGVCTQSGSGNLSIASGADILKAGVNYTSLTLLASGTFTLNANISGQNLDVIIRSSAAYLNAGSIISASTVTVQAPAIYAAGVIQTSNYFGGTSSSPLGNAINLLAQAIYISGRLNLGSNLPTNAATTVLVNGMIKRTEDLPAYLNSLNASVNSLDQVYSSTAANDLSLLQANQVNQVSQSSQSQSNVINLFASNSITLNSTAQILANGTTGASIYVSAPNITTQSGSVIQANGNNGPGGLISFSGDQMTVSGSIVANGTTDGGAITLIANNGDLNIQNALIQTNGSTGRGGSIGLSANNRVAIEHTTIEATGFNQGGSIKIGNDASNGTLPFALSTTLDQYTSLNASQLDSNTSNQSGGLIETSGATLNLLATINAGRGGMWLLDPNNVTISTAATSGGTLPSYTATASASVVNATDIQTQINAGTSVTILANGTITQSAALTFNVVAAGQMPTLTISTTLGSQQAISLAAMTDNTSATGSGVNLSVKSAGGFIALTGAISLKGSVTLDNTYQVGGSVSGYITSTNAATLLTAIAAGATPVISVTGAISSKSFTVNAVSNSNVDTWYTNSAITTSGDINITSLNIYTASAGSALDIYGSLISTAGAVTLSAVNNGPNAALTVWSGPVKAFGAVTMTGTAYGTTYSGLWLSSGTTTALAVQGGSVSLTGNTYNSGTVATYAAIYSNVAMPIIANSGDITITSNVTNKANAGIILTGPITQNTSGGNITFTANSSISQTGAITVAANTSGASSNIIYDTTLGNKTSTVSQGALTINSGSTQGINYSILTAGSPISVGAISVPGAISLNNTYGCAGVSCTPASGFITTSNFSTLATTTTHAVLVSGVLHSGSYAGSNAITLKGITYSANSGVATLVASTAAFLADTGNISINGITNTGNGVMINAGATTTTTSGSVSITGSQNVGNAAVNVNAAITASGSVTLLGTNNGGNYTVWVATAVNAGTGISITGNATTSAVDTVNIGGALTVTGVGSSISVAATNTAAGGASGIVDSGAITLASGSNLTFTSNNVINQSGAITEAANASGVAANVLYNTTAGNYLSNITAGTFTSTSTGANAVVNYSITANGSAIVVPALSTSGLILIDNRCSGCATPITDLSASATNTTSLTGIKIGGNLTAGTSVTVHGINYGLYNGVYITGAYNITAGTSITLDGSTMIPSSTTMRGLYQPTGGTFTAGTTINLTGVSNQNYGGILINSSMSASGNITIFGNTINPAQAGQNDGVSFTNSAGSITSINGNISITGQTVGLASTGAVIAIALVANNGTVTIVGNSNNTYGVNLSQPITAMQISITGTLSASGTGATYITSAGILNIVSAASSMYTNGGVNAITIIGNTNTTTSGGITDAGAVNVNSSGGDVLYKSNGVINVTGTVTLKKNVSNGPQNIVFDTTIGDKNSTISFGTLNIETGSTAAVNFTERTAGAAVTSGTMSLPGYILLDNTWGCGTTGCTPTSGYIAIGSTATLATTSNAINANGALTAGAYSGSTGITIKGISNGGYGANITAALNSGGIISVTGVAATGNYGVYEIAAATASGNITLVGSSNGAGTGAYITAGLTSTAGAISVTGSTVSGSYGIYDSANVTAAGNITYIGYETSTSATGSFGVYLSAMTLNSTGGNIVVNGASQGAGTGVFFSSSNTTWSMTTGSTGSISVLGYAPLTGVNGVTDTAGYGSMNAGSGGITISAYGGSYSSNNGAAYLVNYVANTTGTFTIQGATLSGNNAAAASGVAASAAGNGIYIPTNSTQTIGGSSYTGITATGNIGLSGASSSSGNGIYLGASLNSSGTITLAGSTVSGSYGIYGSANVTAAGNISYAGYETSTATSSTYGIYLTGSTLNSTGGNITVNGVTQGNGTGVFFSTANTAWSMTTGATGSISILGYVPLTGFNAVADTTTSYASLNAGTGGITISVYGGSFSGNNGALYFDNFVANTTGTFTIQGATLSGNTAVAAPGVAATAAGHGIYIFNNNSQTIGSVTYTGILATGNISLAGASNSGGNGVYMGSNLKSSSGTISLSGSTVSGSYGIYQSAISTAAGNINYVGYETSTSTSSTYGVSLPGATLNSTGGNITVNGVSQGNGTGVFFSSSNTAWSMTTGSTGSISILGYVPLTGFNGVADIANSYGSMNAGSGGITISSSGGSYSGNNGAVYLANYVANTTGTFTIQGATLSGNTAVAATGVAASAAGHGIYIQNNSSQTIGGTTYTGITATGNINIAGTSSSAGYGVYQSSVLSSTSGSVTVTGITNSGTDGSYVNANITAGGGVFLTGTNASTANPTYGLYDNGITILTTGTFTAGTDAVTMTGTGGGSGALYLYTGSVITNNSTRGRTNLIANNGNFVDPVTVTNASTAGAIMVSAIGTNAAVVSTAGSTFTQNSNDGVYIASSNNGNVSPPKIINNGAGSVVIVAGAYLPIGTSTGGQITGVSTNTITSPNGNVYLYSGSITGSTNINYLASSLATLTFNNTVFGQAYKAGGTDGVVATSLPDTLINIANIPNATTTTTVTAGSTYGPVIQFRQTITHNILLSAVASLTKVYGTTDPLATAGNLAVAGSLDYALNQKFVITGNTSVTGTGAAAAATWSIAGTGTTFTDSILISRLMNSIYGVRTAGENVGTYNYTLYSNIRGLTITAATGTTQPGTSTPGATLTITAAPLTITDAGSSSVYGGASTYQGLVTSAGFTLTGLVASINGVATGDAVGSVTQTIRTGAVIGSGTTVTGATTPSLTTVVPSNTTYNAVPSAAVGTNLGNYTITYVGNTYTVTAPTIIVTAIGDTKVYGATTTVTNGVVYTGSSSSASNLLGYTLTGSPLPTGVTATGVTLTLSSAAATAGIGSYTITPSLLTTSGVLSGYNINYVTGTLTVTAAPLTVTTNASSVYGSGTTTNTPVVTGLQNGNTVTAAVIQAINNLNQQSVGTYGNTTTTTGLTFGSGSASNYAITYLPGTLTVTPKALTITANAVNTNYGTPVSLGSSAFSTSGLVTTNGLSDAVSGVTLQYNSTATVPGTVNAATYTGAITASNAAGSGLSNYNITYVPANLVVAAAPITITANNVTTTYGSAVTPTGFSITSGQLYNGNTITGVTLAYAGTSAVQNGTSGTPNVGTYSGVNGIVPSAATGSFAPSNYTITYVNGNLTVNKATASISATKVYDGSATFTAASIGTFTVLGVNGEVLGITGAAAANSPDVLTANTFQTLGTLALANGPNGSTQGLASNYQLPTVTTLSITPKLLTASISSAISKTYDTTATATLVAGDNTLTPSGTTTTSGSYTLSGFVSGQGAVINQTAGLYNSANATANTMVGTNKATSVSASLVNSNYTALGSTNLSNYSLPTTVTGTGQITQAGLTVSADPITLFTGVTPNYTSTITGLLGGQTVTVTYTVPPNTDPAAPTVSGTITPAVTSSAISGNYAITVNTAQLAVASFRDMVFTGYSTSKVYGQVNSTTNLATVGAPTVSYCATSSGSCVGNILSLVLTAPTGSGNIWTATDAASGASYTFALTASVVAGNYSAGSYLNVGSYVTTPGTATGSNGSLTVGTKYYNTGVLTVTPLAVTPVNNSTPTKQYDTTTAFASAPSLGVTPLVGDILTVSGTGAYGSKTVGANLNYTISNITLGGGSAANYVLASNLASTGLSGTNGVITPAPLTVSGLVANNKVYDTTTAATISSASQSLSGVIGSDAVNISSTGNYAGVFASKNVANGIAVTANTTNVTTAVGIISTMSGVTLAGADAANYYVAGPGSSLSANITAAPVTISGTRVYNGTTAFSAANLSVSGVGGETLVFASGSGSANSPNVGVANTLSSVGTLALGNGTGSSVGLAGNYTLTNPVISSISITPESIVVSASNAQKVYDATTAMPSSNVTNVSTVISAIATPVLVSGTLYANASNGGASDNLTGGNFAYTDANAGSSNKTVTVSGVLVSDGNNGHNYTISYINNTTSTITPAPVTISGVATFNGTNITSNLTVTGVAGQTLSIVGATATMASANAGSNLITGLTGGTLVSGGSNPGNVSNYTLLSPTLGNVVVSSASITISATNTIKTFDNSLLTSGSSVTQAPTPVLVSGVLYGSDTLSGGNYLYTDVNAGAANKTVTVGGVSVLNGSTNVTGNYVISYVDNTTSTINKAALTVSGLSVAGSVYNGTTAATLTGTPILSGVIAGTSVSLSGAATVGAFSSANAGSNLSVTPDLSGFSLTGPAAANYVLTGVTSPLTGTIAPLPLTATIVGSPTMQYGATTLYSGLTSSNYQLSGFITGQSASISQAVGNFNSANVANANSITASFTPVNFVAASGTILSNYVLPTSATGTASITPAPITVVANNVVSFVGVAPTLTNQITVTGLQGSDTVSTALLTSSVTNTASSSAPGTYVGALVPSATANSNYSIVGFTSSNLTIADAGQLVLTVGAGNNSAVYGTYSSANISQAGNAAISNVLGQYCTNCVAGMVATPNFVSLTVTPPVAGSNVWTATDSISPGTAAQGVYNFTVTPQVSASSYSTGGYLKVGSYTLSPSSVTTAAGQATNYNTSLPVVYNSGTLTITPLVLTFSSGPTTTYNGTTTINNVSVTPANQLAGDVLQVAVSGTLANPNASAGSAAYSLSSAVVTGADAANYIFSNTASGASGVNATVSPAPITVSSSSTSKTYDTTTAVGTAVSPTLVSGVLYTNTATGAVDSLVSVNAVYADPNSGAGNKVLTLSGAQINNGLLNASANYAITYLNNTTSTITPAPLTVSGLSAPATTYNGGTATVINSGTLSLVGALPGASVAITRGTVTQGTLASVNAGSNISVTPNLSALVIDNQNYIIVGATTPLSTTINPAPLTISGLSVAPVNYNGTTIATITGTPVLSGALYGQSVTINSGSVTAGAYASANAGTNVLVTPNLSNLVLSNPNFTVSGTTTALTGTIAPLQLTATIIGSPTMQYNGSTTIAGLSSANYQLSGLLSGQGITINQNVGNLNSPNVANATSMTAILTANNFTANSGTVLSNYILPTTASGAAGMTPAPLTMTANNAVTFIGVAPTLSYTLTGLQGADVASSVLANASVVSTISNPGAGSYTGVLVPSATANSNYTLTTSNGNLSVASNLQLVIAAGNNTQTYGVLGSSNQNTAVTGVTAKYCTNCGAQGISNPTYVSLSVSGSGNSWAATDSYSGNTATYAFTVTPVIGTNSYSVGSSTPTGNYINVGNYILQPGALTTTSGSPNYNPTLPVIYSAGTLSITPFIISSANNPTGGVNSLVQQYNGSSSINNAPLALAGLPAGVSLVVSGSGTLASPNAGTQTYSIANLVLSGADAANFGFSAPLTGNATITPAPITVSTLNVVKTFDNTTTTSGANVTQAPTPVLLSGVLYSQNGVQDILSGGVYTYSNVNAGLGNKVVTPSAVAVMNAGVVNSGNYSISYVNNTTSTINPASLTISGLSATARTYNATTGANLTGTPTIAGNTFGINLHLNGTATSGTFASANAGPNIAVTPDLLALTVGNPNFVIVGTTAPLTATISPAPLTISGLTALNATYTGTTNAAISGTPSLSGALYGQTVTISAGSVTAGSFASPNAAPGIVVTPNLSALTLSNPNFTIVGTTTPLTATINPAPITISGNMVYTGLNSVPTQSLIATGVNGQTLSVVAGSGVLTAVGPGAIGLSAVNGLVLADGSGLASNYTLVNPILGAVQIAAVPAPFISNNAPIDYLVINTVNNFGMNIYGAASFRPVMPNSIVVSENSSKTNDNTSNEADDIVACIPDELDTWQCRYDQ
jgi:filamentous hemagglutinin family protein